MEWKALECVRNCHIRWYARNTVIWYSSNRKKSFYKVYQNSNKNDLNISSREHLCCANCPYGSAIRYLYIFGLVEPMKVQTRKKFQKFRFWEKLKIFKKSSKKSFFPKNETTFQKSDRYKKYEFWAPESQKIASDSGWPWVSAKSRDFANKFPKLKNLMDRYKSDVLRPITPSKCVKSNVARLGRGRSTLGLPLFCTLFVHHFRRHLYPEVVQFWVAKGNLEYAEGSEFGQSHDRLFDRRLHHRCSWFASGRWA